ncbi:MAG: pentapeptide repeat-containing protein [Candidatus Poribacteria bacterium]|nr:pentapeptide repeat-containing protein [Candidatus Poribacteria bacterium]
MTRRRHILLDRLARLAVCGMLAWNLGGCATAPQVGTREIDHELLKHMELAEADLSGANLEGVVLAERDLRKADLKHANLRNADLQRCDLRGANLRNADLSGADLRWTNLARADLRGANLENAVLRVDGDTDDDGTSLRRADLRKANLRGADMRGVILEHADLRYADARGANLNDADLRWTNLDWLKWSNATFEGALYVREQQFPFGLKPDDVGMIVRSHLDESTGRLGGRSAQLPHRPPAED